MVSSSRKNEPFELMGAPEYSHRMFRRRSLPVPKSVCVMDIGSHPRLDWRSRGSAVDAETIGTALSLREAENVTDSEAIRQQLTRILQSRIFVPSERLSRFLRFIVEHVLRGGQDCLKEYVIGSEVYDRKPPYHPSQDSIVRTEARRLRSKLREYYEAEGKDDSVFVYLRPGSYIPAFQYKDVLIGTQSKNNIYHQFLLPKPSGLAIVILPFSDLSGNSVSSAYARGIPDELAYALMRNKNCKVITPSATAHLGVREQDVAVELRRLGAQIAFEGSVKSDGRTIRVTAKIVDNAGIQLWAERFDVDVASHSSFAPEEQIASALSVGFDNLFVPRPSDPASERAAFHVDSGLDPAI